ncbi:DNA repair exonuclease SbcCD nuclease subunit [Psychrobacillus psychrotolerans]|uniref:DNA repair exonuclease SbcCD nuclease subunit n=1 Tax=Psychrobacillus psychrotolerans TaxID=126156 RepID=A0A1I6B8Y5_9BACI|nr:DNA repair exonuclease [Psychrobacillus psychrotolerans]SFQ77364.1 DNA repair exonuclease SbcCD nuclease subunit [Psychrobacillus psychrotolerans]
MARIRFLHVADLHLDSPFKGISSIPKKRWKEIRESTFQAFQNMINYAVENKPDFVLIVGDIYDGENRSLRAQHLFQQGMEALNVENILVYICHGNHDHLSGNWVRFQLPANVHVFGEKVETKTLLIREEKVHITGFSYKERHIQKAMHSYYPISNHEEIHIGMLHGSVEGNKEHDVYAPFRKSDLLEKGYHYWALGHIHKRQIIHSEPPIVYPGNTQSRHRNESGIKGFYEVSLLNTQADLQFVPSSAFIYDKLSIDCADIIHANELIIHIETALRNYSEIHGKAILELTLNGMTDETIELLKSSNKEEWHVLIQESLEQVNNFLIINELYIETPIEKSPESTMLLSSLNEWDTSEWKLALKELYQHSRGSRYLQPLDQGFMDDVVKEAESLVLEAIARRSGN